MGLEGAFRGISRHLQNVLEVEVGGCRVTAQLGFHVLIDAALVEHTLSTLFWWRKGRRCMFLANVVQFCLCDAGYKKSVQT